MARTKIDPSTLPSLQDTVRRLAFEVMGHDPENVTVEGEEITMFFPEDGESVVSTFSEFMADLAAMMKAAEEG